ncbi:MAG: KEOPS complex subunit Cgi121 [Candidatus Diapherotrites archaeon]|nr:KEOPS complex subunit Cgi121 [Candidatus Diapherotrites archaeon]
MIQKIGPGFVLIKTGYLTINTVEESINKTLALLSRPSEFAQIISVKPICSMDQIFFGADQAQEFFTQNLGITSSIPLEFLVRVTAQRQLKDALVLAGLKQGKQSVCLVFYSNSKDRVQQAFKKFEELFEFKEKKNLLEENCKQNFSDLCFLYNISETELNVINFKNKTKALQSLVLERIACLELNK